MDILTIKWFSLQLSLFFREVRKGSAPFLKYYYTLPGNYTFKLNIGTNNPQHSRMTGLYSVDLTVLGGRIVIIAYQCPDFTIYILPLVLTCQRFFCFSDAIRSIELRGPLIYNVDESSSLSFLVGGRYICTSTKFKKKYLESQLISSYSVLILKSSFKKCHDFFLSHVMCV